MNYGYVDDAFYSQYTDIYKRVFTLAERTQRNKGNYNKPIDKILVKLGDVVLEPKNQEGVATPYQDGDIVQFKARECLRLEGDATKPALARFDDTIDPLLDDGEVFDIGTNIYGWGIEPLTFEDQDELDDLIDTINAKYQNEIVEVTSRGIFPEEEPEGFVEEEGYQAWGLTSAIAEDGSSRTFVVITSVIDDSNYLGEAFTGPEGDLIEEDVIIKIYNAVSGAAEEGDSGFADKVSTEGVDHYYLQSMLVS